MPASPTSWLAERHNSLFFELENVHAFLNGLIQWSNGFIFWFLCRQCSYRRTPTKCQKIATHTLRLYVSCYGYISKGILTLLLFLFIRFTFPYTVFYKPFLHVCIDFTRFYFSLACDVSRKSVEIDSPWTVSWDSDQGFWFRAGVECSRVWGNNGARTQGSETRRFWPVVFARTFTFLLVFYWQAPNIMMHTVYVENTIVPSAINIL